MMIFLNYMILFINQYKDIEKLKDNKSNVIKEISNQILKKVPKANSNKKIKIKIKIRDSQKDNKAYKEDEKK